MNHPEKAPARVGAGEGPIKSELRAESATDPTPGQVGKHVASAGGASKKSSAVGPKRPSIGNGLGKEIEIEFVNDDAEDEGWSFSIPTRKGKGSIRIPTWEELTRRNNRTISESDRAAMRTNDNFDDDWKCITIPPEGAGHNKGLVLALWQILTIFERTPEEAVAHLTTVYKRDPSDVRQALNTVQKGAAGGGAAAGGTTRKKKVEFPKANMDAIAKAGRCSLEELKSSSPCQEGLDFSPLDALKHLMRKAEAENPLVCVGLNKREFQTLPIDGVAKEILEGWSYFVPSAMSALAGTKVDGSGQSAKTNDNTGPRLNLVFEGDGITKKQQAGVIRFLAGYVPLVCAVDSGGKSIHAFVDVAGRSPEDHLRLMKIFCRLGGDSAMWTLSQFARMPGGARHNDDGSEKRQEIIYLDLDPPDVWRLDELEAAMAGTESEDAAENEGEEPGKTLSSFRVNHTETLGMSWQQIDALRPPIVIDGFLRQGEVLLLGAESKSRKSWLTQDAGFCVAAGLPWLADETGENGFATVQARVHIFDLELNPSEMRYRFAKARANRFSNRPLEAESMTARIDAYSFDGLNTIEIMQWLEELKATVRVGDLVIVDCLYRLCPDGNEVAPLAAILEAVKRFASETHAGVILVDHFRKAGDDKARNRFAGSFVKQASASTLVAIEVSADDVLVLNIDARTFHGCPKVHARFNPETYEFNRIPEIEVAMAKASRTQAEAEKWILQLWKDRPEDAAIGAADAAERWEVRRQTATPRLSKLVSRSWLTERKHGHGKATEWTLAPAGLGIVKIARQTP